MRKVPSTATPDRDRRARREPKRWRGGWRVALCISGWLSLVGCGTLFGIAESNGLGNGTACAAARDCASDFCIGGICCEESCSGPCVSCALDANVGNCEPIADGTSCGDDDVCSEGICREPLRGLGAVCSDGQDCISTICIDERCCESACNNTQACSENGVCLTANGGTCAAASDCVEGFCVNDVCCEESCGATERCGSDGTCRLVEGQECNSDVLCDSQVCEDGLCCEAVCGACGRCDLGEVGQCTSVPQDQDPDGECGASCDGKGACRDITAIAAGGSHTCAKLSDDAIKCWGSNFQGQLGDGGVGDGTVPVNVVGLSGPQLKANLLSTSASHTCAIIDSDAVVCWGLGLNGQLGSGTLDSSMVPGQVFGTQGMGAVDIAAGDRHTCAVFKDGGAKCWGYNLYGQLGNGASVGSEPAPVQVVGLNGIATKVFAIAAGEGHSCAVTSTGLRCWGDNGFGQLGHGGQTDSSVPMDVQGLDGKPTGVCAGAQHTCGLLADSSVRCWGRNNRGQLGDGAQTGSSSLPVEVVGLSAAVALSCSFNHTCALLTNGEVMCWGGNQYGQLGNGSNIDSPTPVKAKLGGASADKAATGIAVGEGHSCAVLSSGEHACWGNNAGGQIGSGDVGKLL